MKITDKMIKNSCSPTIYKRGTEYFREGRVHLRRRTGNRITAVVDDENIFSVDIEFENDKVTSCFCTCPYYQTMRTACKHIVAALCQRRAEQDMGAGYSDGNDKIAADLCRAFAAQKHPKEQLFARFELYINKLSSGLLEYGMSIEIDGVKGQLGGIENFLEAYARGNEFRIDKNISYVPDISEFPEAQDKIISILAESYLNRSANTPMYTKAIYRTTFGAKTAARLFPYLAKSDFSLVVDGMCCHNLRIIEDNPDMIIDITATDEDILLAVSDRGLALTDSGEWFMYENAVYHTDDSWRGYFMPIYRALSEDNRLQITFKGNNRILFAKHILPMLSDRQGVVADGLDELVVDAVPQFTVYFDAVRRNINAVVLVRYGSVSIRLPSEEEAGDKIVVRDTKAENEVLAFFSAFSHSNGTYTLSFDNEIYYFIKHKIERLSELAEIKYSESFMRLMSADDVTVSAFVDYNSKIDMLEADFESSLSYEDICGILSAIRLKNPFYRFNDGRFIDLLDNSKSGIFKTLAYLDFSDEDVLNGKKTLSKYYTLYLDSDNAFVRSESFRDYVDKIKNITAKVPENLDGVLRDYQKTGITWLCQLSALGFGGILADDMGLGKTLQVLAYIHGEKRETPTLIVTPSALMYNWLNEINRFVPDASALIIDGSKERRKELLGEVGEYEFIITSYPILRRDIGEYKDLYFEYLFIDEAQHIKNAHTMSADAVKRINAKKRFAITGTPIENALSELWSIFDFIMPGYLYDASAFRQRFEIPIAREGDNTAAEELRARIKPFIMRRMKSDVLRELPEKIEETIYADLTPAQRDMYVSFLAAAKDETLSLLYSGGQGRMKILALLMRLRQICCHPSLFDKNYTKDSGKLNLLMELVRNGISGGHRILVFSQFTSMLTIIADALKQDSIDYFYLDGKTPSEDRAKMSEEFNGGKNSVFLISLKAGGMGLNLTGADMVVHFDPWWNPAVTDQASDRAYRIGQMRAVHVIKLAMRQTIEEKILKLQDNKRCLAEDIITANNNTLKNLTNDEIMALFS